MTQPRKAESTDGDVPPMTEKEFQAFLGIINYLGKFSSSTADVCKSLRNLMSAKTEWTWNGSYQKIFNKAKSIKKEDAGMNFYDETKQLHIEIDISGVGLGDPLL